MTRDKYIETLSFLKKELEESLRSRDEDRRVGTVMALEAFLRSVKVPS